MQATHNDWRRLAEVRCDEPSVGGEELAESLRKGRDSPN
jgi:hypothetical protein